MKKPATFWNREALNELWSTCVIIHNLVVEDEREMDGSLRDQSYLLIDEPFEVAAIPQPRMDRFIERMVALRHGGEQTQLRNDLMQHIWSNHHDA